MITIFLFTIKNHLTPKFVTPFIAVFEFKCELKTVKKPWIRSTRKKIKTLILLGMLSCYKCCKKNQFVKWIHDCTIKWAISLPCVPYQPYCFFQEPDQACCHCKAVSVAQIVCGDRLYQFTLDQPIILVLCQVFIHQIMCFVLLIIW